jgi:hypothetical protein
MPNSPAITIAGSMIRPLLVAEPALFAGVRIQPAHRDPRFRDIPIAPQPVIEQVDRLKHLADGELVAQLEQPHVGAGQGDAQPPPGKRHGHPPRAVRIRQVFGVARTLFARVLPAHFVDRSGHDRVDTLGLMSGDGRIQKAQRRDPRPRVWPAARSAPEPASHRNPPPPPRSVSRRCLHAVRETNRG